MSVTIGLRCDDSLRQQVAFLSDPALPLITVNETCEDASILQILIADLLSEQFQKFALQIS